MRYRGSDTTSHEAPSAMRGKGHRVASSPPTTSANSNTPPKTRRALAQHTDRNSNNNSNSKQQQATAASNSKQGAVVGRPSRAVGWPRCAECASRVPSARAALDTRERETFPDLGARMHKVPNV
ncbi:UNVERIFIED_CONTAM: hypothetical protein Sindi_0737200 [Sesamum indicum]